MAEDNALNLKFEVLLEYLRRNRGFDFTGYKRSSLMRRVQKRMDFLMLNDFPDYIDYLEVHPDEFNVLFNAVLINVTSFFRDAEAWQYLQKEIVPRILSDTAPDGPIRIWSAGCASGEEAYSIAITMCEAIGAAEFQRRVKIYATDVDEEALAQARHATYSYERVEHIDKAILEKYFVPAGGGYTFRPDLRRAVIFGRHDLVQDAPISNLDLVVCRNTLMYLNAETQARILARLHFALKPTGFLFLGKAEMMVSQGDLFSHLDLQHRVFSKLSKTSLRDRLLVMAQAGDLNSTNYLSKYATLRDLSLEHMVHAHLVVDAEGKLSLVNERARTLFGINLSDIGRPFQDLEISYRPLELRSLIEQSCAEKRAIKVSRIESKLPAGVQLLDVQIAPLHFNGTSLLGASITFEDVSEFHRLFDELQSAHEEMETTNEELQSTNEELETTNEELQSTNEELETTNEELQSTNEELETTNEELQSTNEELESISEEQRRLTEQVFNKNVFLDSILSAMGSAVIVVDAQSQIRVWNQECVELWGLRTEEVIGRRLSELDIGLPTEPITALLKGNGSQPGDGTVSLKCVNRRGRSIECSIRVAPLASSDDLHGSVIFITQ